MEIRPDDRERYENYKSYVKKDVRRLVTRAIDWNALVVLGFYLLNAIFLS